MNRDRQGATQAHQFEPVGQTDDPDLNFPAEEAQKGPPTKRCNIVIFMTLLIVGGTHIGFSLGSAN